MVHGLAQRLATSPISVDSVHSIQIGGDVVTKDTLSNCAALFPSSRICINHGMTEGGGAFTWPFFDTPIGDIPYFGEMCPVGKVAAGATVRIWDVDAGAASPRNQVGELHICCASLIPGYLNDTSASSFYQDRKGEWFITGDMAMMNADGLVYILGRKKDMIKRAGIAVMPAAIENCIEKFTGEQVSIVSRDPRANALDKSRLAKNVLQTCVVPVAHSTLGNLPFAVVRRLNGKTKGEIQAYVVQALGSDYALRDVCTLKDIGLDRFPLNATYKVIKPDIEVAVARHLNATAE
jgi:4-coumarate--CoA ligase